MPDIIASSSAWAGCFREERNTHIGTVMHIGLPLRFRRLRGIRLLHRAFRHRGSANRCELASRLGVVDFPNRLTRQKAQTNKRCEFLIRALSSQPGLCWRPGARIGM
jgi:hypothetical protein